MGRVRRQASAERRKHSLRVVLTHSYSDSNKGDLAITLRTIDAIREHAPDATFTLHTLTASDDVSFDHSHRYTRDMPGVLVRGGPLPSPYSDSDPASALRDARAAGRLTASAARTAFVGRAGIRWPRSEWEEDLRQADIVIAKGGQYLYDGQGLTRETAYLWRNTEIIRLCRRIRKVGPVLLGHSVGPLGRRTSRHLVARALEEADATYVREPLSLALVQALGQTDASLIPDLALMTRPARIGPWLAALDLPDRPFIAVTVVDWSFPGESDVEESRRRYTTNLAAGILQAARHLGCGVTIVRQVDVVHHGRSDRNGEHDVVEALLDGGVEVRVTGEDLTPSQLSTIYGLAAVVVGTRLHSCILGLCGGAPAIGIAYQGPKTQGVLSALQPGTRVHDVRSLDPAELSKDIVAAVSSDRTAEAREMLALARLEISEKVRRVIERAAP